MKVKSFWEKFHREIVFFSITLVVVLLDQLLKSFFLSVQPQWQLGILKLHLIQNTGAGFGILSGQTFWLGLLSLLVALGIIIGYKKIPRETFPQLFTALFLGGVMGNMLDRLLRGFVVDFVDFSFWPAFNLADSCLTISVIALVVYFWKK